MLDGPLRREPGTYAVILRSRWNRTVQIGRWGVLNLRRGYYVYVGSALGPGGLSARVSRHCRGSKAKHWHIDYLREHASPWSLWFRYSNVRLEHDWAAALARMPGAVAVNGFGCSDCRCEAHLFFVARSPSVEVFAGFVEGAVDSLPCDAFG